MNPGVGLIASGVLAAALAPAARADAVNAGGVGLEEVVISASLRGATLDELPQSATVLDRSVLQSAGVQHFEDVLGPGAGAELGLGHFATALLPAARHRRNSSSTRVRRIPRSVS